MFLATLDPALLIYSYDHWQARAWHCFERCKALALHCRVVRKYEQRIAMSSEFAALVQESFPWNESFRGFSQLRDLRQFIFQDLQRAYYVDAQANGETGLEPDDVVCQEVEDSTVIDAWERLLRGCVDEAVLEEFEPVVATWETESLQCNTEIVLTIITNLERGSDVEVYHFPLIWNDDTWATHLATQDWWPDLHRCVELCFKTNPGMRDYPEARDDPIPFDWTQEFYRSLARFCVDRNLRRRLIEALTKRVYEILDASLGDEPLGDMRRLRVTDFWRVHYYEEGDQLILEEFCRHDTGIN
jgi:hypothetical protein